MALRALAPTSPPARAPRRRMPGAEGLAALGPTELLAVATGRSVATAAALAERLDGPAAATMATCAELERAGLSRARALALSAACELTRRALAELPAAPWVIRQPGDLGERLMAGMGHLEREELRVVLLNTKNVVTALLTVYVGSLAGSGVRVGEVFREPVRRNAAAVVVAHNHPSGDPTPSGEDLRITAELAEAGRLLDIALLDHLVIGRGRWVSLRSLGAI